MGPTVYFPTFWVILYGKLVGIHIYPSSDLDRSIMGAKKSPQATLPITGQVERRGISILPGPDRTGFNENMCNWDGQILKVDWISILDLWWQILLTYVYRFSRINKHNMPPKTNDLMPGTPKIQMYSRISLNFLFQYSRFFGKKAEKSLQKRTQGKQG